MAEFQLDNAHTSSIDIIRAVVESMTFLVEITDQSIDGNGYITLTVCNIFHAQKYFTVTIGGNDYEIESIEAWDTIVLKPGEPITVTSFYLYTPKFFHGTPIATGEELEQKNDAFDKTPMVWMMENFRDRFGTDPSDPKDREITFRLFFLTQPIIAEQETEDAYNNAILPMRSLAESFINRMKEMVATFDLRNFEFDVINYAKFGVYITEKGMPTAWCSDQLSGVEIPFERLVVWEQGLCQLVCP